MKMNIIMHYWKPERRAVSIFHPTWSAWDRETASLAPNRGVRGPSPGLIHFITSHVHYCALLEIATICNNLLGMERPLCYLVLCQPNFWLPQMHCGPSNLIFGWAMAHSSQPVALSIVIVGVVAHSQCSICVPALSCVKPWTPELG